ncbi:MAG: DUF4369 domain-containing protein [Flavobacteriaceae bacterium]|jgi:hypothetical protein|nr:DUF4369 domain-containing protein [Flavobacteriaceae bacterium]MCI5089017.1 DUF4369 domain-containing protein [Flavobacteriaceae bacterium]CAI8215245.1 MAG: Uncharacterised protein [SAR116 cluster bacterium]
MKNSLIALLSLVLLANCTSEPSKNTMMVSGNIKGLKKGTLYLQHIPDSTLVALDSVVLEGSGDFSFEVSLESPEVFYLYLDKKDFNDLNDRITFFGEPGSINIQTKWNSFDIDPEITGSKSQEKLIEYRGMMSKFNIEEMRIMEAAFKASSEQNSQALDSLQKASDRNTLRSYLFALNYAMNNADSYVAPYVAVTDVSDANPKFLDSIYNKLSPEVAASKYGKLLEALVN